MTLMDDRAQIGLGWIVIMFIAVMAFGFFMWQLLSPMYNQVFDVVNTKYVETGEISQANYDAGNVVRYAWLAFPMILVIGLLAGYLLRSIVMRGY
jgi:hypothetical protein